MLARIFILHESDCGILAFRIETVSPQTKGLRQRMTAMKTLSIHIYHKVISMISLNIYQISLDKVDIEL